MSNLSIGLVTSPNEESKQLISLLEALGVQVTYHITPQEISSLHIEDESLNVWLLNMEDDDWHDNIDQLLDESDASIYFNEPGTLIKQSHPDYWCQKLVSRLYELTGLDKEPALKSQAPADKIQPSTPGAKKLATETSPSRTEIEKTDSNQTDSILTESHHSESDVNTTLESGDELSSALEQLETSSIGLPSDIAAELVSELESISPDLEAISLETDMAIDDSLSLESELSFDPGLSLEPETEIDQELSIDHLEIAEPSESAGIADEIMALAADPEKSINDLESTDVMLDEIDFSNSSIPILESAREDDQKILESVYGPRDEEAQPSSDDGSPQQSNQPVPVEIELADQETNELTLELDGTLELDSDLSLEDTPLEQLDQEITGKANFIQEEITVDEEIVVDEEIFDIEEPIEQDEMSLTSIEEEQITGKAVFLEEEQSKQVEETVSIEQQSDGLSLESIDQAPTSGRAIYIEDEPEEQPEPAAEEPVTLEDGGLSLESDLDKPTDGKAQFVIDDQPKESELKKPPLVAEKKVVVEQKLEDDPSGLNLQPIDDQNQASWLSDDLMEAEKSESEITEPEITEPEPELQQSEQETDEHFTVADEDLSPIDELDFDLNQQSSVAERDDLGETATPQEFEIPMLEESATGMDFEEVIQPPTASELTPCWVIGASLGGPAAVKRFLQSLPADINASFIVVQHIDENFLPVLAEILTSNSHFEVQVAKGSNSISAGKIYLAPLKGKLIFLKDGSMLVDHSQKWSEPYLPCIDDVIESLAAIYGKKSGAIIFSGMGQDGLNGVKKMLSSDGQVWAQSVDTCANSSMPEAVINAGLASVVAAPEKLADRLVSYLNQ